MKDTRKTRRIKSVFDKVVLIILMIGAVLFALPFVWMVLTSFDKAAIVTIPYPPKFFPKQPSFYAYIVSFSSIRMPTYIMNSLIMSISSIILSCCSAFLSGYALSKIRFKGARVILLFVLSTMMIPFESTMVSRFLLINRMGLINTYAALYLPAVVYPFGTFLAKQFMDSLPNSLREAAKIDGAGEFSIFFRIYLPLCGTIIATMIILQFLGTWNELLWPLLVLNDVKKYNVQIGMAMFKMDKAGAPMPAVMMAITTISILPVLIVYLFLQRYVVEGIAMSGLKQ